MEKSQLRQRLIGALVLVALAAIIVPFFLGDQDGMPPGQVAEIPAAPEQIPGADIPIAEEGVGAESVPAEEVTADTVLDSATPASTPLPAPNMALAPKTETAPAISDTAERPVKMTTPVATASPPGPTAWVVQLGSFSSEQNAWALRDKLRNKGYHAFVERISEGDKMVIRVRIGPELVRAKAEAVQQKLEKEMKIKGIVMPK